MESCKPIKRLKDKKKKERKKERKKKKKKSAMLTVCPQCVENIALLSRNPHILVIVEYSTDKVV
jgi:tRNA (Thr-GGU) A37 N-methylase